MTSSGEVGTRNVGGDEDNAAGSDWARIQDFISRAPKVELHAHLNGCVREGTLLELASERSVSLSPDLHRYLGRRHQGRGGGKEGSHVDEDETLLHRHSIPDGKDGNARPRRNLSDCFQVFDEIHRCVDDLPALRRVAREALDDFYRENVAYLELRSTPRQLLCRDCRLAARVVGECPEKKCCDKREYIVAILDEFKMFEVAADQQRKKLVGSDVTGGHSKAEEEDLPRLPLMPRFLISVDRSRSVEEATENVALAIDLFKAGNPYVVGVDLGGNPTRNDFRDYVPALQMAKDAGLKVSVHCGEVPCAEGPVDVDSNDSKHVSIKRAHDETLALIRFRPDRLGHALFLPDAAQKLLSSHPIPIECCPTSNVLTLELVHHQDGDLVDGLTQHPHLARWIREGYPISVNTDDPGVFFTNSTVELLLVAKAFGRSEREVSDLVVESFGHAFERSGELREYVAARIRSRVSVLMRR